MLPKYKEVAYEIEKDIINRKYDEGNKLPTVEELMKEFQVSKNTIRSAIDLLVEKGYVYQVQGSGIFLRQNHIEGYINISNMKGLTKDLPDIARKELKNKIIKFEVVKADEDLANKMKCDIGAEVYNVKRLRLLDGKPFSIEDSYFNKNIVVYLNNEIIENSIYSYITEALNYSIGFANKKIYCEKLSNEDAKLIGLSQGENTIIVENTVFLTNGLVFDVSKSIYNYLDTKFIMTTNNI